MNSPLEHMHPDVQFLYEYWRSIFPDCRLPGRQHFDPAEVLRLLPSLLLIDVHREPISFKIRLVGSKIEEFAGENLTGKRFAHRLKGSHLRRAEKNLRTVVKLKEPSWRRGKPLIRWEKNFVELERLFLPLASDGETVDMILAITVHSSQPAKENSNTESRVSPIFQRFWAVTVISGETNCRCRSHDQHRPLHSPV
jgi:hypothetical protein